VTPVEDQISLDSIVAASPAQVSCALEDELAILHLRAGRYYGLDPVGARVWQLIAAPRSLRTVRDALVAEYDVDAARCEADLLALVRDLAAAGLVEIRAGAA
jgi:hypothetical protein